MRSPLPYFVGFLKCVPHRALLSLPGSSTRRGSRRAYCLAVLAAALLLLAGCSQSGGHFNARATRSTIAPAKNPLSREITGRPVSGIPTQKDRFVNPARLLLGVQGVTAYSAHRGGINAVVVGKDGSAYSGGDDGQVVRSTVVPGRRSVRMETLLEGTKPVLALALSPDNRRLAIGQTSLVTVFDVRKREIIYRLSRVQGRVTALAWDPRGELVGIGMTNGAVHVWSLREGMFEPSGRDSLEAIESYVGGVSPIVKVIFHPAGRAFFTAEQEGVVSLWRLLRTEEEIGLRDEFAVSDQGSETANRRVVGNIGARIDDLWLNDEGSFLYVSGGSGIVYSWKVRGLVRQPDYVLSQGEIFSLSGWSRPPVEGKTGELLVASGREQWLRAICIVRTGAGPVRNENLQVERADVLQPVLDMGLFSTPINRLAADPVGEFLWAAEKGDNLLLIDPGLLFSAGGGFDRSLRCND